MQGLKGGNFHSVMMKLMSFSSIDLKFFIYHIKERIFLYI